MTATWTHGPVFARGLAPVGSDVELVNRELLNWNFNNPVVGVGCSTKNEKPVCVTGSHLSTMGASHPGPHGTTRIQASMEKSPTKLRSGLDGTST